MLPPPRPGDRPRLSRGELRVLVAIHIVGSVALCVALGCLAYYLCAR